MEFSLNKKRPDGYNSQCKKCHIVYRRNHYLKNKQKYIDKASVYRTNFWKWFNDFKPSLICSNCGENRHWVLDFHHLDSNKKDKSVSVLVNSCSKKKVLNEIKKCTVLCSNCHRDLHYKEKAGNA